MTTAKAPIRDQINDIRALMVGLYPNGKVNERTRTITVGDFKGEKGQSCTIYFKDGHGFDFNGRVYHDVVDVVATRLGCDARDAIRWLRVNNWLRHGGSGSVATAPPAPEVNPPTYRLKIAPPDAKPPRKEELDFWAENQEIVPTGPPDIYPYRTRDGGFALLVVRWPTADGKEVRRASWSGRRWQLGGTLDAILPLYRLPELLAKPEAGVLVCEGEKATDAAVELWPQYGCTCPVGGSGPAPTSWWPLQGRDVMVLGDNDDAGKLFVLRVRDCLDGIAASVRMLKAEDVYVALGGYGPCPKGWDVADHV